jgi:hypothetical protein
VKALIDLIQQDESIDAEEEFYILETGEKIKRPHWRPYDCLPTSVFAGGVALCGCKKKRQSGGKSYL